MKSPHESFQWMNVTMIVSCAPHPQVANTVKYDLNKAAVLCELLF